MRKSDPWRLAIIILAVLVALFVDLNIEHPDWAQNLLFWRPTGQRDIALHPGLDLQGGLQVLLAANVPEGQELDAALMETARRIIENRANNLALTKPVVQVQGEHHIIVELPGIWEPHQVTDTLQAMALVEFVGASSTFLSPGTIVETTLGEPPVEEPAAPVTPTTPITPTTPPSRVFETVLSSDDLDFIALYRTGRNEYTISFALTQETTGAFTAYTLAHGGQYLCVALDKEIISCANLPSTPLKGGGGIPARLSDEDAQTISVLLRYGPLPVPLQVEEVGSLGPALGETAVKRSGRAVAIGLIAVLLFLPLHYRLPGLLADLSLLIFALLNLALCKVIPLPLILPSLIGFAVAALLTIGGHLSAFECLREEMRAGRPLSRAIEAGFSRAWPSIRDTHLVLLVPSIAMWYIGATAADDAIHWLGVTLLVGVLISLFVTMVVTRTFVRLTFDAAREWLDERKWLLGI